MPTQTSKRASKRRDAAERVAIDQNAIKNSKAYPEITKGLRAESPTNVLVRKIMMIIEDKRKTASFGLTRFM